MERLSYRGRNGKFCVPQGYGAYRSIADKLGAYEDLGLEPEALGAILRWLYEQPELMKQIVEYLGR